MKKNTIKAFTLVEMLIVIVIIGILIAALMPRMQAAQGRARDVSRKTALSQLQTAIVTFQGDKGYWPGSKDDKTPTALSTGASSGISINLIQEQLNAAGMNSIPTDPNNSQSLKGLGEGTTNMSGSYYGYLVTERNGVQDGGFVLMAQTEVEGGSNRVVCDDAKPSGGCEADTYTGGWICPGQSITNVQICENLNKGDSCSNNKKGTCTYQEEGQLRYVMFY